MSQTVEAIMKKAPPPITFATRLAALRAERGYTVYRLAQLAGLQRQHVAKLERGDREPSWTTVQKLAAALSISTDALRVPSSAE